MVDRYTQSGVNIQAGYEVSKNIKAQLSAQEGSNIGNFGGIYDLAKLKLKSPVMVSGADGVGTKLLLAIKHNRHETIGIDCVAMCVNDVIAQGAQPLYFMDYLAVDEVNPDKIKQIISGVIQGCQLSDMQLIGGETAEMSDLYAKDHYDLAGFATGVLEKSDLLNMQNIQTGDAIIGLISDGVHANGFSLIRDIFFKKNHYEDDEALVSELLKPTHIYYQETKQLLSKKIIKSMAHITGGGFFENIPRSLPQHLAARIKLDSWPEQAIFGKIANVGDLTRDEMFHIFNMGIGMTLVVSPEHVADILSKNKNAYLIGEVMTKRQDALELVVN